MIIINDDEDNDDDDDIIIILMSGREGFKDCQVIILNVLITNL